MNRLFVVLILVLAVTVVVVPSAQADTRYFCVSSGDWDVAGNWEGDDACTDNDFGVPTADDRAIILSDNRCNIDSAAVADTLNVESTATLNIEGASGNSLTLDGDFDSGISTIAGTGTLNLLGSNSVLAFKDNSQTIDGAGKIVGQDDGALISIANNTTLTSDTIIEGKLKITGLGDFVNTGIVHANVAGTLFIDCNSIEDVDDVNVVEWQISTSSSAILRIDPASGTAAVLDGDFTVSRGTLAVDSPGFETSGRLTFDRGTIDCTGLTGSEVAKFTG